ncbi:MAG: DUF1570 domain-containing protein [Aureliella sp.]|jgi:hypothetical protein
MLLRTAAMSALVLLATNFLPAAAGLAQGPPPLLEVVLASGAQSGLPIHWAGDYGLLLEPSGMMRELDIGQVQSHRVLETPFIPQTLTEARATLQAELGAGYETGTVGPYVLAAPRGHVERWRERFRVLLAGYHRYFETRGWQLRTPDFPLCVIILPSKADFDRYCMRELGKSMPALMGYYFPKSNRCVLFEVGGDTSTPDWSETERTIVHESVHQLAYNTGVHQRLADNPQWVVEGLATMFEQRGVFDPRAASRALESRINPQQLAGLKKLLASPTTFESQLGDLIGSNDMFRRDAPAAYALSWGLTYYLAERMSNQYGAYTQRLAQLPKLQRYEAAQRQRDFQRAFESDVGLLAIQMQRFFSSFK